MVALRKESVDRNHNSAAVKAAAAVALRKESVDRNQIGKAKFKVSCQSLSARRAWIEMLNNDLANIKLTVALRKESVDRNIL